MAKIISGKEVSAFVKGEAAKEVKTLNEKGISVCLAVILVGDDPASAVYVNNKKKACEVCGIKSLQYILPESTTEQELLTLIEKLNNDMEVNGILCQLPLPEHINEETVINAISPKKDVDCFHPENVGRLHIGNGTFKPCTPAGVMEMIHFAGIQVRGKKCVVVGRSNIVGKPMGALLMAEDGTVTICHSKTQNLEEYTKNADILVVAMRQPRYITGDMVKDSAVVVDVGIHRLDDGTLCGDVDFNSVEKKASYITPVPGGVGPMTIAILMQNTVTAAKMQNGLI
ncbi:MAG: bifunctional methylenetetrahydrofolate dehydrogenase/methenyltetrahydrofolate cyclohydrolase FolD [Clostridia bacterium]|nr:bifunctional methylenetetrahydrofolate dehydrogenase/methenyltetrahydrofolate cyclohydrolase FolD [Clostridia bacterium]